MSIKEAVYLKRECFTEKGNRRYAEMIQKTIEIARRSTTSMSSLELAGRSATSIDLYRLSKERWKQARFADRSTWALSTHTQA